MAVGLAQHCDGYGSPDDAVAQFPKLKVLRATIVCVNTYELAQDHRRLESDGWFEVGQTGSHIQFKHPSKIGRVTVVHPRKDYLKGKLRSIEKQAKLTLR